MMRRTQEQSREHAPVHDYAGGNTAIRLELCVHIFTVSAGLVGVCLTVIGLFRVIHRLSQDGHIADNLIAIDALGFLAACLFAYLALRAHNPARRRRLQQFADVAFLLALGFMVAICGLIAYELI